jgi:hypothetical protein
MRAFFYDALSMLNYEVATAGNGAEGFKQFIQNSFDTEYLWKLVDYQWRKETLERRKR